MDLPLTYPTMKRSLDVAASAVLLVVTFPLGLLIALGIYVESGGPVLYRQTRIGRRGEPFTIYKFRTLHRIPHTITDPHSVATRVGRILRRWGLDELPQLWNILRGEMSLVGPRPTLPTQVERYGPFERKRLDVRPGLTGWAQIHGRNALDWPERIRLDVWYVEHRSWTLDLQIVLRTPRILLRRQGIYGADGVNPDFPSKSVTL